MTVLLTVLFKTVFQEPSIHAGCSLFCDSGPGTINKAAQLQKRAAFFSAPENLLYVVRMRSAKFGTLTPPPCLELQCDPISYRRVASTDFTWQAGHRMRACYQAGLAQCMKGSQISVAFFTL